MPFPRFRPRFTLRGLMVAVVLAAVLLASWAWVAEMRRRSREYRALASMHAKLEATSKVEIFLYGRHCEDMEGILAKANAADPVSRPYIDDLTRGMADLKFVREAVEKRLAHDVRMREKYARAANRPWIAAPPDPPRP